MIDVPSTGTIRLEDDFVLPLLQGHRTGQITPLFPIPGGGKWQNTGIFSIHDQLKRTLTCSKSVTNKNLTLPGLGAFDSPLD